MPDSPAKYCAIPSSEDQAFHSDVHETGANDGTNVHSIHDWSPAEGRIRWTYFLLGCAILLPWNALINGTSFFLSRMTGSPFYSTFSSYLSSVFTLSKLVCQFYCTVTSKKSSSSRRIFVSIIVMILLVTSLCLSTYVRGTPSSFFLFALFVTAFLGASAGYLCTATYAGAALLDPSFLQTALSGQGAVSAAASAVQVASSVISLRVSSLESISVEVRRADGRDNQPEEVAARIFFGVSAVFLGITLVAYAWLTSQSFYKSVTRTLEQRRHGVGDADELTGLIADDRSDPETMANISRVYQVLKQNLIFMFSIAYVFTVTLAVFPAITARVQSVDPGIHPLLFTAVHSLVFSIGDLAGRYSYSFPCLRVWSGKKILTMSLLRTLFIPLILLCNIHRPATISQISPMINSDVLFMIILLAMGYTNGFVLSLAAVAASSLEHNPRLKGREDVDVAATLGGSFASLGLVSGALCSFGVQAMI